MKIAIFTDVFLEVPGGIPSSIQAQKASLEAMGHEVIVFCPGWEYSKTGEGVVKVPSFPKFLSPGGAPLSRGPKTVEAWVLENFPKFADFDIVHVHYEASCSIAGVILARRFRIPLVQTMHGREDMAIAVNVPHPFKTIVGAMLNFLHSRYIRHEIILGRDSYLAPTIARAKMWTLMVNHADAADVVLTPSKHFKDKLKRYGVKKPIEVVSNGVSDEMVKEFDKMAMKKKGTLVRSMSEKEPLKLIWNSRVSNEKRMMPFLEAISLMKRPVELSVYGDGNALRKGEKFVKRHKLNVKFYGRVKHQKILEKMVDEHMGVMASYGFDTQGLTLLEAEATGLPVFFVDPDMKEVVPRFGAVRSGPSPREMAWALDRIKPEKIEEMSTVMLECRREVFQSTQIKRLLEIYKGLISK
ncbi:glycosyltransferase [Candidatus Saccharibacteria bacterium]|nr:glycosyltransferase [Candidatus Saccharibacteria bacterium]